MGKRNLNASFAAVVAKFEAAVQAERREAWRKAWRKRHPKARKARNGVALRPVDVIAIRKRITGRHGEQSEIAFQYGVTPSLISKIASGKAWPNLLPSDAARKRRRGPTASREPSPSR